MQVSYLTRLDKFIFATSLLMSLDIVLELVIAHLAVSVMPDRYVERVPVQDRLSISGTGVFS